MLMMSCVELQSYEVIGHLRNKENVAISTCCMGKLRLQNKLHFCLMDASENQANRHVKTVFTYSHCYRLSAL